MWAQDLPNQLNLSPLQHYWSIKVKKLVSVASLINNLKSSHWYNLICSFIGKTSVPIFRPRKSIIRHKIFCFYVLFSLILWKSQKAGYKQIYVGFVLWSIISGEYNTCNGEKAREKIACSWQGPDKMNTLSWQGPDKMNTLVPENRWRWCLLVGWTNV